MRFGREGAAPIVILPGLSVQYVTDSAEAVAAAYGKLAADYDIYLFDRRTDVPEKYSIRQMAEDTAQAMQILGLHQAGIFGVSQGRPGSAACKRHGTGLDSVQGDGADTEYRLFLDRACERREAG